MEDDVMMEDDDPAPTCARCGGEMVGGELLAQGPDRNWLHRTDGPLGAVSTLVAWACVECGWVDLYLADIDRFLTE
jgi:hypothetical protein